MKKSRDDPSASVPYLILFWRDRSTAFLIGASIRLLVRKAARLAVYEETMIRVKRYHTLATNLVDDALGAISLPVGEAERTHVQ